ncbi:MAG: hydrolase or metal-binding protein [Alcanivoracaceae bacterium]|nr:hydrolase or metal-binding protein [Alcanivoracaceae bacterium]
MIKNLAITPPIVGRISIGRVVEKNGKRLPEKDDQFTLTTQIQTRDGWLLHPLDEQLRKDTPGGKLRSIPVRMLFDDPDLNLRAEYTLFDRQNGRPLCVGDGETCRRQTEEGIQTLPCPSSDKCPLAANGACKPYGRLSVRVGDDEDVGVFVFRTTGYNSIRTLAARLRYYQALSGGVLAALPLALKLRGKSTTQSHRTPIYYVDLTTREDQTLEDAILGARVVARERKERGIDQAALDDAARAGFGLALFDFEEDEGAQVVEEFMPEAPAGPESGQGPQKPQKGDLGAKLAQRQQAVG